MKAAIEEMHTSVSWSQCGYVKRQPAVRVLVFYLCETPAFHKRGKPSWSGTHCDPHAEEAETVLKVSGPSGLHGKTWSQNQPINKPSTQQTNNNKTRERKKKGRKEEEKTLMWSVSEQSGSLARGRRGPGEVES